MGAGSPHTKAKRIDIISDTHGYLTDELLRVLSGADLVIHAGDITSEEDWETLSSLFPVRAVLGNNDYFYDYGAEVGRVCQFEYEGLKFAVSHYRENLPLNDVDVAVCGHTHRPVIERVGGCLLINPGSTTFPRTAQGPTIARMFVSAGAVDSAEILRL